MPERFREHLSLSIAVMEAELPYPVEGTAALSRSETQVEVRPVVAKLLFTDGPRAGEEIFLEAYEVTFGRSKKADIFLDDEKLSRIHAKITRVGMGYRLIDMNSRNGTYVNGMRVLEHPLSSFDVIEIGNSKIKFLIHDIIANEMGRGGGDQCHSGKWQGRDEVVGRGRARAGCSVRAATFRGTSGAFPPGMSRGRAEPFESKKSKKLGICSSPPCWRDWFSSSFRRRTRTRRRRRKTGQAQTENGKEKTGKRRLPFDAEGEWAS